MFFNAPIEFNDPFEVAASVSPLDEASYQKILSHYRQESSDNNAFISKKEAEATLKKALNQKQKEWLNNSGCWCASKDNKKILMWSHYGDSHKGMCLKFKTSLMSQDLRERIEVVKYSKEPVSLCHMCLTGACKCSNIIEPLYSKFVEWDYEEEVRVFHREPKKEYGYGVDALEAVYFGARVNPADRENVCLILRGQSKNIKFFNGELVPNFYEVIFREFSYIPYVDLNQS